MARRKANKIEKAPEEQGEACSVVNEDCLAPAGWKVGGAILENPAPNAAHVCSQCGDHVCSRCSVEIDGERVCDFCNE